MADETHEQRIERLRERPETATAEEVRWLVEECAEFIEARGLSEYVEDKNHAA